MSLKPHYRLPARGGTPTWVKVADSQNRSSPVAYKDFIYLSAAKKTGETRFSKYNIKTGTHTYFGPQATQGHSRSSCRNPYGILINGILYFTRGGHGFPNGTINKHYKIDPSTDTVSNEISGNPDNFGSESAVVYQNRYIYGINSYNSPSNGAKFMKYDTQTGTTSMFGGTKGSANGSCGSCIGKDGKWYATNFGQGNDVLIEFDFSTDTYTVEAYPGIKKASTAWNISTMRLAPDGLIYLVSAADNGKLTKVDTDTKTVTKETIQDNGFVQIIYIKKINKLCIGVDGSNKKSFLFNIRNNTVKEIEPPNTKIGWFVEDNSVDFYGLFDENTLHKLEYQ